jgi:hypothetical protein
MPGVVNVNSRWLVVDPSAAARWIEHQEHGDLEAIVEQLVRELAEGAG